ncbi:MAG: D-alanyl-D-alanine carboxypeptidase/D-alanyl-D-alanine endopeptidase [Haloechinothrix sp.]
MAGRDNEGNAAHGWPTDDQDGYPTSGAPRMHQRVTPADQPTQQFRAVAAERPPRSAPVPPAPTHAMPVRIEASEQATPTTVEPRRGRRGLLITVLAVVVVAALAAALALPDVSNRLALPWAPNAPTGPEPAPIGVQRSLPGPDDAAPAPTASGVEAALDDVVDNPALGSLTGSVVDPVSGAVLWEQDADRPLTPASTTKLLTAAAALLAMEHTTRLATQVVAGDEPGAVVVVAGGDPTLTALPEGKDSVYPGAAHLDDLVEQVRDATGGEVDTVSIDLSAYTGSERGPGWAGEDVPSTYAARADPAMLDGGRTEPTRTDSPRTGDPAAALAAELADRLGARVAEPSTATARPGAEVLGEVESAPLTGLVDNLLTTSDNVLAEAIARQVAIATGAEPSFTGAATATLDVLRRNGFDLEGVELSDGSGLSVDNKIPARLLTELLAVAAGPDEQDPRAGKLRPLLGGLPVAGGSGTLADRYDRGSAQEGKGWVRAKTGTLSEVNTLAGVVLDSDGRVLVFALMSAGSAQDKARPALDAIAATLRGCGCG